MKRKHVVFSCIAWMAIHCLTTQLIGQTQNPTATWVAMEQGFQQGQVITDLFLLGDYVHCQLGMGSGTIAPTYYPSSMSVRLYAYNSITFSPSEGASIRSVELTCKRNGGKTYLEIESVVPPQDGELVDPLPATSEDVVVTTWNGLNTKGLTFNMKNAGQRCLLQIKVTYTSPTNTFYQVTYTANGGVGEDMTFSYAYNSVAMVIANPYDRDEYVFDNWNTAADGTGDAYNPGDPMTITDHVTLYAQWTTSSNLVVNVLDPTAVNEAIGDTTDYVNWEINLPDAEQPRVTYKGKSSKNINYIQMNSTISGASSYSGIVTTQVNNLKVKKMKLKWHTITDSNRVLEVYGKNTPYSGTTDLYGDTRGTLLASIVKGNGNTAELEVEDLGTYSYLGFRSNSGTIYLSEIRVIWETLDFSLPAILIEPSSINLGNVVVDQPLSVNFTVSQANLSERVKMAVVKGELSINGEPNTEIPLDAEPTLVTWTYTPSDEDGFVVRVLATSDSVSSSINIQAKVLPANAQTLHESKANFIANNGSAACINLEDVEVIGQSGPYLYLQDAEAGVLVYGTGAPTLHMGDKFVSGYLVGTYENYHGIIEIKNFQFVDVVTTEGELTCVAATVDDILSSPETYDARYVQLSDVTISNWTVSGANGTLAFHDRFQSGYATKTAPETTDLFTVKGLLNGYYSNSVTQYQIDPVALTDISTTVKAGPPAISPRGTETDPSAATTVLLSPSPNTKGQYCLNDGQSIPFTTFTYVNLFDNTTVLKAYGIRDFYANSDEVVSYYRLPANTFAVKFSINGVVDANNNVLLTDVLDETQTPSVTCLGDFSFVGWSLSEASTEVIELPYTVTSSIVLYAVYVKGEEFYYKKVNNISDFVDGEYVILAEGGSDKFTIKNGSSTHSPTAHGISSLGVSISNDGILEGDDLSELTWTFRGTSSNMTITSTADPTNYLYIISGSSTGVRVGHTSENTSWTITEDLTLAEQFNMKCNDRYKVVYNEQDWRSYLTTSNSNSYSRLLLFKKQAAVTGEASRFTRVFWNETATSDIVLTGPSIIPSGYYLDMADFNLTCDTADHFIIENDAHFKVTYNNTGIMAKVMKNIDGYVVDTARTGWHLLSSPVGMSSTTSQVDGLEGGAYDLYAFMGMEWQNDETEGVDVVFGEQGSVLYANREDTEITFTGELISVVGQRPLLYVPNMSLSGWNLIGNPYTCEGFLNIEYTGEDEGEAITTYYRLKDVSENGKKFTKLIPTSLDTSIAPMEGVFVEVPGPGYKYWFVNSNRDNINNDQR